MKYKRGYKYQVDYDEITRMPFSPDQDISSDFIDFSANGILIIKKGYAWDGASGPVIDRRSVLRASLVHDALAELMRQGLLSQEYKIDADLIFKEICIQDNTMRWLAETYFQVLKRITSYTLRKNAKKVYTAP